MTKWTPPWSHHKVVTQSATVARSALASDDAFQTLFGIDLRAKVVYLASHLNALLPVAPVTPAAEPALVPRRSAPKNKTIGVSALQARPAPLTRLLGTSGESMSLPGMVAVAVDALRDYPKDIDFARRVILLRAEAGMPPLAPIPATKKKPGLASPLLAFAPGPGLSAKDNAALVSEQALWKDLFSTPQLGPNQSAVRLARRIRAVPNLRWYGLLALHQLYLRAGNPAAADREQKDAVTDAILSIVPIELAIFAVIGLLLVSVLLLLAAAVAAAYVFQQARSNQAEVSGFSLWLVRLFQPRPPAIPNSERRLGAGDLMDVFVFYLFSGVVIGLILEYLAAHPLHAWVESLSFNGYINFAIVAEFIAYVLNGFLALWLLLVIARRRGASLAAELGLTTRRAGQNILFGLMGWSLGYGIMIAINLSTQKVFRNAPEPTNPAETMIVDAHGFLSHFLMYVMAAVAAPFFEELLFRGVFFNAARIRLGPWPAIILTGLVFGFAHPVGVGQAVLLGTLGAVFAWMAYTRKSLVPSMTGHFLQNTFSTLMMWFIFMIRLHGLG